MGCINKNLKDNQRLIQDFSETRVNQLFDEYFQDENPSYGEFISNPNVKEALGIIPISKVKSEIGKAFGKEISSRELKILKKSISDINDKLLGHSYKLFNIKQKGESDNYSWGLRKINSNINIQAKIDRLKQRINTGKQIRNLEDNQFNFPDVNSNLNQGLQWLKEVNPNVQPEIVQGLIDGIANGSYNSNLDLITLSEEFANKGTTKHEYTHLTIDNLFETEEHYVLDKLIKNKEIKEDCTGKSTNPLKAEKGLQFNFKHGGKWKIIKDLKGYPTHEKGGVDLTIGKNGVSIKNGDTQFTAKYGLVIPKAQNGLTIPSWMNPKNWGVTDYSDKGDFSTAYSTARKNGEKEFMWNNQRYNTNYKGTPQQQLKETGLTNEQIQDRSKLNKNLTENIYPYSYNNLEKRIWKAGVLGKKEENREAIDKDPRPYDKEKLDALNLYAGVPQKNNTFRISNYKPSISKDNINYYTFNKQDDKFVQNLIDYAYLKSKGSTDGSAKGYDVGVKGLVPDQEKNVMGNYKMSTGKDDRGAYVSFYDEWDLAPMDFGKPFEIYDRIYTKDYGDGKQKRMYYTDKELSELNIDKKDFDTLGLQRELSNRGYKLPKSTKQDGSFDGIWGDETNNALLEYRKSQNKSKQ